MNILLHTIFGTIILIINSLFSAVGIAYMGGASVVNLHNVLGMILFIGTLFVAAGGYYARYLAQNLEWKSIVINRVVKIHKVRIWAHISEAVNDVFLI